MARSNGEGTIYQRSSDGKWVGSWYEEVNGQRRRRVVYGTSSTEVQGKLRKALGRIDQGLPGLDSSDTFQAVAETWRRTVARTSGLSSKTQQVYADVLKLHVYPVIGKDKLRDLKPSRVSAVLIRMEDAGLSKSYQHQAHKAMSKVFQTAMVDGLIATNPVRSVKAPRGGHKPKVVPDRRQVTALLEAAPDARMRALVGILAYTGCRISEALGIKWSEVNDERIILQGKGGKSRAVPVTPALASILAEWRSEQRREQLAAVWWDTERDWALSSDCGTQWDPHNARKKFRPLADAILPGMTPHSLRHATATLLLEERVPMKVVAELLGHSSTRITEDTYSHVTARLVAEAGSAIERALG
ncbi:MAG: site-specific integrase [Planctomycetales bacterium]|nr:site-specific integrase [Planctomycetales bacterium]MCO5300188.1 site-specific integrase [Candidatus Nanopelagicales bacterium]